MTYSKEARQHAKANGLALFAVQVDGRTSGDDVTGCYSMNGPLDCALARSLWFFCNAVADGKKPEAEFAKHFKNGKPIDKRPKSTPARSE